MDQFSLAQSQTLVQLVLGYVMAFGLERLKGARWFPWLTENSLHVVKVAYAWVAAAASAIAVTWNFDPTLGRLIIDGLTWANVRGGLTAFLVSLIAQKFAYRLAISPKEVK